MSVKIPCWPVTISRRKLKIITQTIDDMSTPNAGGIRLRTGLSNGSVGHAMILYGNLLRSVFGYQEITVLNINNKLRIFMKLSKIGLAISIEFNWLSSIAMADIGDSKVIAAIMMGNLLISCFDETKLSLWNKPWRGTTFNAFGILVVDGM